MGKVKEATMTLQDEFVETLQDYNWLSTTLLYQINFKGPGADKNKILDNISEASKLYGKLEALAYARSNLLGDDRGVNILNGMGRPLVFERAIEAIKKMEG